MKRYSRGWMYYRLENLLDGDSMTTPEVKKALKVSEPVIRRWLVDPYFQKNKIASKDGPLWIWDIAKLKLWVIAILRLEPREGKEGETSTNPPNDTSNQITPDQARQFLKIPQDYYPRSHAE